MKKNRPTALLLAETGSAWLVFIFPSFSGGRFVDGPGIKDSTSLRRSWVKIIRITIAPMQTLQAQFTQFLLRFVASQVILYCPKICSLI